MGIPELVPFRDRIAGTHGCHSAFADAESPVGLGARLHCHACRPRDRHHPRRIRARCATTRRGDMVSGGRLDKLAQAANRLSVTDRTAIGKLRGPRDMGLCGFFMGTDLAPGFRTP